MCVCVSTSTQKRRGGMLWIDGQLNCFQSFYRATIISQYSIRTVRTYSTVGTADKIEKHKKIKNSILVLVLTDIKGCY